MGWFSSACSAVSGFIGGCCSAISSACSAIGGAIAGVVGTLAASIAPFLAVALPIVSAIANLLGIGQKDIEPEQYGEAMTLADKKPEDFDSINEYIDYLSAEIKDGNIDFSQPKTEEQKAAYKAMGCSLMVKGIDEKYNLETDAEFWGSMGEKFNEGKINENEVKGILETCSKDKIDTTNVAKYIEHEKLDSNVNKSEISGAIMTSLKEANPTMSDEDTLNRFNTLLKKD